MSNFESIVERNDEFAEAEDGLEMGKIKLVLRYLPESVDRSLFVEQMKSIDDSLVLKRFVKMPEVIPDHMSAIFEMSSKVDFLQVTKHLQQLAVSGSLTGSSQMIFVDISPYTEISSKTFDVEISTNSNSRASKNDLNSILQTDEFKTFSQNLKQNFLYSSNIEQHAKKNVENLMQELQIGTLSDSMLEKSQTSSADDMTPLVKHLIQNPSLKGPKKSTNKFKKNTTSTNKRNNQHKTKPSKNTTKSPAESRHKIIIKNEKV